MQVSLRSPRVPAAEISVDDKRKCREKMPSAKELNKLVSIQNKERMKGAFYLSQV
jgi:hypothetical protein